MDGDDGELGMADDGARAHGDTPETYNCFKTAEMGSTRVRLGFYSPRMHRDRKGEGFGTDSDLPYPMERKAVASDFGKRWRKEMERGMCR
jgi:hypothetical protein